MRYDYYRSPVQELNADPVGVRMIGILGTEVRCHFYKTRQENKKACEDGIELIEKHPRHQLCGERGFCTCRYKRRSFMVDPKTGVVTAQEVDGIMRPVPWPARSAMLLIIKKLEKLRDFDHEDEENNALIAEMQELARE